jgi:mannose-6-phosphate isomerase-like protein (cupin superfamily)
MQRNAFIKLCLTFGAMMSTPMVTYARFTERKRIKKGFKVDAGKDRFGKNLTPFDGDSFFTKVSSKDTDGDLYVFESTRLEEGGPALHYHYDQDELWYVLEGEFLIKVGDKTYEAKAGDSVFGPRRVTHCFAKVGKAPGKLLMVFQPAGKMEECFSKLSAGVTKNMTPKQRDDFRKEHGFERVGPALTILKQ